MITILYDTIFSYFLGYVTDFDIANMKEEDAYVLMVENLHKAVSKPYLRHLFSSIQLNDHDKTVQFQLTYQVGSSEDKDFVLDILAKSMVVEWIQPQVKSKLNIAQLFTGSESKFYSQSNHLSTLISLLDTTEDEVRRMIRDRGYIHNSYLGGN